MKEPLITTEYDDAILRMHYMPTTEWAGSRSDVVAEERELTRREARRLLDVFYDVSREFTHIELGLI